MEIEVNDRSFNQVLVKGLIIPQSTTTALTLLVGQDQDQFITTLEQVIEMDKPAPGPKLSTSSSNKRSYDDAVMVADNPYYQYENSGIPPHIICFNCGVQGDHYANSCPEEYNQENRNKYYALTGKGNGAGRGGKGYGK